MAKITLKEVSEAKAVFEVWVKLDRRGNKGYYTDLVLNKNEDNGEWAASMGFTDMPTQESVSDAINRMGLYLTNMAKAIKSENFEYVDIGNMFKGVYTDD